MSATACPHGVWPAGLCAQCQDEVAAARRRADVETAERFRNLALAHLKAAGDALEKLGGTATAPEAAVQVVTTSIEASTYFLQDLRLRAR